jgi:hypothetical protein
MFNEEEERILFCALQEYRSLIVSEMEDGKITRQQRKDYKIATELRDRILK